MDVLTAPFFSYVLSGEFTLRAFLNGRLDLSQAENVEKLIPAKFVAAADAALAGIQVMGHICYHILATGLNGYMAIVTNPKNPSHVVFLFVF
ncbi:uncharacterized protein LOC131223553 [Magnolia sinica]|uniref:uncharacterized protein LOC131223553 n=1 Tax=Magnolia sinica TaxID=86752 RepID=UPI002659F9E3|nr:uncharacterized protein LOC131223553 [Magnolia sinica]